MQTLNLVDLVCYKLIVILMAAIILDLIFAEPPEIVHPAVWFGKLIGFFDSKWKRKGRLDFVAGVVTTLIVILLAFLLVLVIDFLVYPLNLIWATYLLYTSISVKSMVLHAKKTYKDGFLDVKHVQMIVSRNTTQLNEGQLASAVIESISENFVDGVLAPLFYFSIFGVFGAVIYRAINVCDAMVGYKDKRYYYFGKFTARLDDLANFIPSRLSILLFSILSLNSLKYALKYKIKMNGHSIAAMAGLLNVRIEKPGKYLIDGKIPKIEDIERCIKYYWILCALAFIFGVLVILLACVCKMGW